MRAPKVKKKQVSPFNFAFFSLNSGKYLLYRVIGLQDFSIAVSENHIGTLSNYQDFPLLRQKY